MADEDAPSASHRRETDEISELASPRDNAAEDDVSVSQYLVQSSLAAKAPRERTASMSRTHVEASPVSNNSLRSKSGVWARIDDGNKDATQTHNSQTAHAACSQPEAATSSERSATSVSKAPRKKTAREMWRRAIAVANQVGVLARFRTLRDYNALEISREQLLDGKKIGEGAFAVVERFTLMPSKRSVAVKRLKPHVVSKSGGEQMLAEIALLRKLRHRNIIEFIGFGSWDTSTPQAEITSVFMVEEFVDGGTLKALVSRQMKAIHDLYKIQDAVRWLSQIASGLAYLHQCQPKVIHRDLKLENILMNGKDVSTQQAKIADFGLSALVSPFSADEMDSPQRSRPSYSLTEGWTKKARSKMRSFAGNDLLLNVPGVREDEAESEEEAVRKQLVKMRESSVSQSVSVALRVSNVKGKLTGRLGTLMYMAPEVYMKKPYNDKADVYSFAIIAYELLHRYQMISATDGSLEECMAYAHRAAHSGFRPPIDESLPKSLKSLITRCWDPEPDNRPTMEEALGLLASMLKSYSFDRHDRRIREAKDDDAELRCCFCC